VVVFPLKASGKLNVSARSAKEKPTAKPDRHLQDILDERKVTVKQSVSKAIEVKILAGIIQAVCLSIAVLIGASTLLGYYFGVESLYAPYTDGVGAHVTAMAPLTAVALLALTTAIILEKFIRN
jgi:hypothetical protein